MKTVLELNKITKHFDINKGIKNIFSNKNEKFIAVDNVNLKLQETFLDPSILSIFLEAK